MALEGRLKNFVNRLSIADGRLHVLTAAGIGDLVWLYSKWWSVCQERDVTFWFPDAEQHRAGGLAQLYGVKYRYMPELSTQWVWGDKDDMCQPDIPDTGGVLRVNVNRHLEAGKRIERWYPDLLWQNPAPESLAGNYKLESGTPQYVVVFMCHQGYMEGNLMAAQWSRICQMIEKDTGSPVLLIGADNDVQFISEVVKHFDYTLTPMLNAPIAEVIPVLRGARSVVGVASGITILSTYLGVPTYHAYPRHLAPMPGTWEHEEAVWNWCHVDELENSLRDGVQFGRGSEPARRRAASPRSQYMLGVHDAVSLEDRPVDAVDLVEIFSPDKEAPAVLISDQRQDRRLRNGNGTGVDHGGPDAVLSGSGVGT